MKAKKGTVRDKKTMWIRNKKGDIPITVLVIGVFGVCSLALLTFFVADFKMSNSLVGVPTMQEMNADIDEYLFYKNEGKNETAIHDLFNMTEKKGVNYLGKRKSYNKGFLGFNEREVLLFEVSYPAP